ncbi:unnamed protein product [Gongylonema pulchrum]|uniref:G_PROTEIN_RECEP_F1_2 domain-containing protein n=1 Tax=Gongylonema pulchrum TaxID=637853 RepID=A0A183DRU5_9BILA|nr:unnamed protein product [Gongylonema pulchrum]
MRTVSIPYALLFGTLFVILTTVGLVGNLVVIAAIAGDKKMRNSVMNMLLFNLAVADALNLITTVVEWSPTIALGRLGWILPAVLCPVARYLEIIFLFVSIMTQLIVCVERYIAIAYPMHARRLCSRQNIFVTILITWLFSIPHISASSSQAEIRSRSEALRTRRNVVKMLVACVSIYFICYSPIQGIFLSKALFGIHVSTPYEFILLMNALAMMCSACNPLLYTLFSKKFRARITRILPLAECQRYCCCCFSDRRIKHNTSFKVTGGTVGRKAANRSNATTSRKCNTGRHAKPDRRCLTVASTTWTNHDDLEEDDESLHTLSYKSSYISSYIF